ncbi:cupin domain-containing protein [Balneolales bacterium ANBcel1]|nr:cupin domain-containing protein [Balneolales bacterium ANBcel1]
MSDQSKIIRSENFTWPEIKKKEYKSDQPGFQGISRFVLLGEKEDEQGLNMQTRYFEIERGGYSSLERHRHPHTVVIVKGQGSMILGNSCHNLEHMDTVYISPGTVHQFHADLGEPLGFICVVDRYRDRPETPVSRQQLETWISNPEARDKARI